MAKDKGILYVMSTVVDGLIKVGKTGSDSFEQRMYNLEHNGYCNVTGLKRKFAIEVDDYSNKEDLFKKIFQRSRVADTELYSLDINQVIQLLSSFEGKKIYPQDESKEDIFEQATDAAESSSLPDGMYTLEGNVKGPKGKETVKATLKVSNGELTLLKGSILSTTAHIGTKGYAITRDMAQKNGNILVEDVICNSVSMAAAIVCGSNQNGWDRWKDSKGNTINIYRSSSDEN